MKSTCMRRSAVVWSTCVKKGGARSHLQPNRISAAMSSNSYSIWAMSKDSDRLQLTLQSHINTLSTLIPDAPPFPPHVTLIGGITHLPLPHILSKARSLANILSPYTITFDKVTHGTIFHQCVYIACTQDTATMEAGRLSREIFIEKKKEEEEDGGISTNPLLPPPLPPTYMPHLSLLYSDIEEGERRRIAEEYEKLLSQEEEEGDILNQGFVVDRLSVWETPAEDKTLKSWQVIEEMPFYWQ